MNPELHWKMQLGNMTLTTDIVPIRKMLKCRLFAPTKAVLQIPIATMDKFIVIWSLLFFPTIVAILNMPPLPPPDILCSESAGYCRAVGLNTNPPPGTTPVCGPLLRFLQLILLAPAEYVWISFSFHLLVGHRVQNYKCTRQSLETPGDPESLPWGKNIKSRISGIQPVRISTTYPAESISGAGA